MYPAPIDLLSILLKRHAGMTVRVPASVFQSIWAVLPNALLFCAGSGAIGASVRPAGPAGRVVLKACARGS